MVMRDTRIRNTHHCSTPAIWALWQNGQTQTSPQWTT